MGAGGGSGLQNEVSSWGGGDTSPRWEGGGLNPCSQETALPGSRQRVIFQFGLGRGGGARGTKGDLKHGAQRRAGEILAPGTRAQL